LSSDGDQSREWVLPAEREGVQGAVALDLTIDPRGKVSDARVVRSIPLLDAAAVAAARQWEFAPTLIDGKAVPIIATIELTFRLATPPLPASAAGGPAVPAASTGTDTLSSMSALLDATLGMDTNANSSWRICSS
jgi:TonB family protein